MCSAHSHICRCTILCGTLTCIVTGADWSSIGTGSLLLLDDDDAAVSSFPDGVILCDGTVLLAE